MDVVIEEVEKLKKASTSTEVVYPSWLANIAVVKKKLASVKFVLIS